ncbi:hypothetical protein [Streptacidiphilus sp. EB103A]|uniref:hypothetical protein n=1 Tax=Streptacidiphilus sp. EB103A TaxID=3156275 RepID=UPI00351408CC
MSDTADYRRDRIRALLADAPRERLVEALSEILDVTTTAMTPISYDSYGIGGWRSDDLVRAEFDARTGVAEDVDAAILIALTGP